MLMFSVPTLSNEAHVTDPKDVKAIVLKLSYQLGKLAGLVQSSYIPTVYSSLLFRFQGIHTRGVNSLQGLVDMRQLSSPLANIIPVTTNDCFSDVGFRNNKIVTGWGSSVRPIPANLFFYPGLGPAGCTQTGLDIPRQS